MRWRRGKLPVLLALVASSAGTSVLIRLGRAPAQAVETPKPASASAYLAIYDVSDLVPEPRSPYLTAIPSTSLAYVVRDPPPSQAEINDQLIKLITDTVESDSWVVNGGTYGRIRIIKGRLLVTQTRENHIVVGDLLQQLREQRFAFVRVYDIRELLARDSTFFAAIQSALAAERTRVVDGKLIVSGFASDHERVQILIDRARNRHH